VVINSAGKEGRSKQKIDPKFYLILINLKTS
jgi:hypothetical protein